MPNLDFVYNLLDKLCFDHEIIFSEQSTRNWPDNVKTLLLDANLLQVSVLANEIFCPGCHQNCFMEVEIYPKQGNKSAQIFINCNQPEDLGRIELEPDYLKQFSLSRESFINWIAQSLSINASHMAQKNHCRWFVSLYQYGEKILPMFIDFNIETDNTSMITLVLAGYKLSIIDLLEIKSEKLQLNKRKLNACMNNPKGSDETSEERKNRLTQRRQQLESEGKTGITKILANEEGVTDGRIKQILAKPKPAAKTKKITDGIY